MNRRFRRDRKQITPLDLGTPASEPPFLQGGPGNVLQFKFRCISEMSVSTGKLLSNIQSRRSSVRSSTSTFSIKERSRVVRRRRLGTKKSLRRKGRRGDELEDLGLQQARSKTQGDRPVRVRRVSVTNSGIEHPLGETPLHHKHVDARSHASTRTSASTSRKRGHFQNTTDGIRKAGVHQNSERHLEITSNHRR